LGLILHPVGVFKCSSVERYSQPHQPQVILNKTGVVEMIAAQNFETALEDLEGFDKIWLIFGFHKSQNWNPKVAPPRSPKTKRGLFSTRSPNRPNALGLSCVDLLEIKGLKLFVQHHDLLDETPIYDIKPYLPYCDSHPESKAGWVDEMENHRYKLHWEASAIQQKDWLLHHQVDLQELVESTLSFYPESNSKKRIKKIDEKQHELAVKTWRILYELDSHTRQVKILSIVSGYDEATIIGIKKSNWDDVPLHRLFLKEFNHA
jgi:tRNA-Thr(GGU) m(6)t(6)A37 methyltransferase TsaA